MRQTRTSLLKILCSKKVTFRKLVKAVMFVYLRSGPISVKLQAVTMLAQSSVWDYIVANAGASID